MNPTTPAPTPIAELKTAFHKLVAAAFKRPGERVETFARIPADPTHDADLLVAAALDELAHLRERNEALTKAHERLRNTLEGIYGQLDFARIVGLGAQIPKLAEMLGAIDAALSTPTSTESEAKG